MRRVSLFSVPTALALLVVAARSEDPNTAQNTDSTAAQQKKITQQERNQQSTFDVERVSDAELKKSVTDLNKASTFMKMTVQNMQNEKLGTVNDIVFDPESGKISYAVLSVGGFLGVGDKLVAVPLTSLRPQPGQNFLVLNMTKDELTSAPGLAKNNWPNLNDPSLGAPASAEQSSASSSTTDPTATSPRPDSTKDQPDSSKSSDKLSSGDKLSTPDPKAEEAQGSSPSTSSSSGKSESDSSSNDSGTPETKQ